MSDADPDFADRRRAILQQLAEIGLDMARRLDAVKEPTADTVLASERLAKCVRQTLALEARIAAARPAVQPRQPEAPAHPAARTTRH